jgi:hypothetical protein
VIEFFFLVEILELDLLERQERLDHLWSVSKFRSKTDEIKSSRGKWHAGYS